MEYITIKKFASVTGYSEDAIRAKIKRSIWKERIHWLRAPDGRILINPAAVQSWVESL